MINTFLSGIRQQVILDAAANDFPATPYLRLDRHIAASLLQKSIRRGHTNWALIAAQRLFDVQPSRFWRRLVITLFEDVGLLDRQLVLDVLGSAPRRNFAPVSWTVAAYLVRRLCETPKTQVANNLLHLGRYDINEAEVMVDFDLLSVEEACFWITDTSHSLVQRAKAVWQFSGVACAGHVVKHPLADPERVIAVLTELSSGLSSEVIAREGVRLTGHVLPLVCVLEADTSARPDKIEVAPDPMPPEEIMAGLPSWVLDQYTRAGKATLRRARYECPSIAADLEGRTISAEQRYRTLADAHFEFESANLSLRAQIPAHISLWRRVQALGPHRHPETANVLYEALRADWGRFQEIRMDQTKRLAVAIDWFTD